MAIPVEAPADGNNTSICESSTNVATSKDGLGLNQSATHKPHVRINPDSPESVEDMLRLLKGDEFELVTDASGAIIRALESIMMLDSLTGTEQRAKHFIKEVDAIAPFGLDPETYAYEFRETLVDMASYATPRSSLQDVLVETFTLLAGDNWKYIHSIGIEAREAWNLQPCPWKDDEDGLRFTDSRWINFTSFLAKLFSEKTISWMNFPLWEMMNGLEYPLTDIEGEFYIEKPVADTRVRVAAEWIFQSAPRLLLQSLHRWPSSLPEEERDRQLYENGPLYPRPHKEGETVKEGWSIERWCFWKRRFLEIRAEVKGDLCNIIDDAVLIMNQAEMALGELGLPASKRRVEAETQTDPTPSREHASPVKFELTSDVSDSKELGKGKEI